MKVLFTGMLSAHCKAPTSVSNKTFFTSFSLAFPEIYPEAEIEWRAPDLSWDKEFLSQYDLIFIGLVPPTSLSANMIYGTLKTLDIVYEWGNVHLLLDSPQLWQYVPGFTAISKDPSYLVSDFYSKRPSFNKADTYKNVSAFKNVADKFLNNPWPKTLYPALPWQTEMVFEKYLPNVDKSHAINLDHYFLREAASSSSAKGDQWAVENYKSKWAQKLNKTVSKEFTELRLGRTFNDSHASDVISSSLGLVIPPIERGVGTWWSYRYIQGLLSGTPIATDWTESMALGPAWSVLPYQIEEMDDSQRRELAKQQLETYKSRIYDLKTLKSKLEVVLSSKGEVNA